MTLPVAGTAADLARTRGGRGEGRITLLPSADPRHWIRLHSLWPWVGGGYFASRRNIRRSNVQTAEARCHDTARGFLARAVASLATAALLTFAVGAGAGQDELPGPSVGEGVSGRASPAILSVLRRSQQSRLDGQVPADPNSPRALLVRRSFDALVGALGIPADVTLRVVRGEIVAETILGRIVVASEALADLAEGERRFVLAHELGHVQLGHWRRIEMLYEKWIPGPVTPERTDPVAADLGREASAQAHQHEFDADAYALRALGMLGESRQTAVASFAALGAGTETVTHPGSPTRLAAMQSLDTAADTKP